MKKNKKPQPAPLSSNSDDSSSSSSEGEGMISIHLSPSSASKRSTTQKKPAVEHKLDSDNSDSDFPIPPKPRSKPQVKRALALNAEEESKRSMKQKVEAVQVEEEGKRSVFFLRLWSQDDEIAILKGVLDYKEEKGADPLADSSVFHNFIKKSLQIEVETKQVVDKIRKLKKRYQNSFVKKKNFSPHEQSAFDLSSRIWGDRDDADNQKSNAKTRTVLKAEAGSVAAPLPNSSEEKSWQFIGKMCITMGLNENIVKAGLGLCSQEMKALLEEKWKQLYLDESDLFLRKVDLASQESKMITEAFNKSTGILTSVIGEANQQCIHIRAALWLPARCYHGTIRPCMTGGGHG